MALHNVASPLNHTNLQAAFTAAQSDTDATVEIVMPAESGNINGQIAYTSHANTTNFIFRGQGKTLTTIVDTYENSSPWFNLTFTTTDMRIRIEGFTYNPGANWELNSKNSWWAISANTYNFGIRNLICDCVSPNQIRTNHGFRVNGWLRGFIATSRFTYPTQGGVFITEYGSAYSGTGEGDEAWATATDYGGNNNLTIEDCLIEHVIDNPNAGCAVEDSQRGANFVSRFNTIIGGGHQTHPTGSGGNRMRGARHQEIYCNNVSDPFTNYQFNFMFMSSGTLLMWNNPVTGEGFKHFITLHGMRRRNQAGGGTYNQVLQPDGWGHCGPSYSTGTVNTSGTTVTRVSGTSFNTSWEANTVFWINGTAYLISSVASANSLTLTTSAGTQSGVAYSAGSNWDGNTDTITGYPQLDQPGRGEGDLLSGAFPNVTNVDNGNAIYSSANAWPRQALEPIYIWDCPHTPPAGSGGSFVGLGGNHSVCQENRDYYLENPSFNGTAGIGEGTFVQMMAITSPTPGVGFWVTDRGDWNRGSNSFYTGQGQLYIANSTGQWELLWEPAQYPHYLRFEDGEFSDPTPGAVLLGTCLT